MIYSLKLLFYMDALQLTAIAIFYYCLRRDGRRLIRPLDVALVLAIPAVGLFGHNKNVFYGFLFLIPLLSIGKPGELVRRYLLILPLFPALSDAYMVGSLYLAELSAISFFNLGALTALAATRTGRAGRVAAMDWSAWLFFLMALLMQAHGVPFTGTLRFVGILFLSVIPPFYIVARMVGTKQDALGAMLFLVLGGFCNAIIAIFEARRRWPLYRTFSDTLHIGTGSGWALNIRAGFLRAQGAIENSASLGLVLALALLVVLALRSRFRPAGRWPIVIALVIGIIACQSRGSWVAAGVGVVVYLLYEGRISIIAALTAAAGVAFAGIMMFAPEGSRFGELVGRSGHAESTAEYRSNLLTRGLQEVAAHPWMGQTRDQLEVSMNDLRQGEHIIDFVNTHLTAALSGGLGGFALWMAAWAIPMVVAWRLRPRRAAHDQQASLGIPLAMMAACFACLTFTSTIDRMLSLVMLSVGMASAFARLARTTSLGSRRPLRSRGAVIAASLQAAAEMPRVHEAA